MLRLLSLLLVVFSTGCSSFHGKWKQAISQPPPANSIAGPWEGRWISSKNGHNGRLRCILTETGTNTYQAHFHATYWKIFRAAYEVPFTAQSENGVARISGESNLGKLAGGVYKYEAAVTPTEYKATYTSKYDHGRFEMTRPERQP